MATRAAAAAAATAASTSWKMVPWRRRLAMKLPDPEATSKGLNWREKVGIRDTTKSWKSMDWREKIQEYKNELSKGVRGYFSGKVWKPLFISARERAHLRRQVLQAGEDWTFDPPRKPMKVKMKGHKCDRLAAERRAKTAEIMKKMPQMLLDYKKRRWEKKMKAEEGKK